MKARLIFDRRVTIHEDAFVEMVLWELPQPARASVHRFKYRLALVTKGNCVLRYDNEAGKGDHIHENDSERPYPFSGIDQLVSDFSRDVKRWTDDNRNT